MRTGRRMLLALLLLAAGCGRGGTSVSLSPVADATSPHPPSPTGEAGLPRPTQPMIPTPTPPEDLHITPNDVVLYPGPELYSGDLVSFEVIPQAVGHIEPQSVTVRIYNQTPEGLDLLASGEAGYQTFDRVPRIRIPWVWDTSGVEGEQTLRVELDPDDSIGEGDEDPANNVVDVTVDIRPGGERHPAELSATWMITTTQCCVVHYLTGTAAERDLVDLVTTVQEAVDWSTEQLGVPFNKQLDIFFIGRVIGQGGYAQYGLALSYLDRRYASYDLETVIRHEAVHVVDVALQDEWPPPVVREGLAVWASEGHFRPEPIPERTAALVELELYVPLVQLADEFYHQQHEASYLEAAALVSYLVDTYGWDGFVQFYAAFDSSYESPSGMLDASLMTAFGIGLEETEEGFLGWLSDHAPDRKEVLDVQTTIRLFETVRLYQQIYDPSAHFLGAWLVDPVEAESLGVVADLMRHPRSVENVALEAMLLTASNNLISGNLGTANAYLSRVEDVLMGRDWDPVAADYLAVVEAVAAAGYEVQSLELAGPTARVSAIADWPELVEFSVIRTLAGWIVWD